MWSCHLLLGKIFPRLCRCCWWLSFFMFHCLKWIHFFWQKKHALINKSHFYLWRKLKKKFNLSFVGQNDKWINWWSLLDLVDVDFDSKSWIVDFFTRFTHEKGHKQNNYHIRLIAAPLFNIIEPHAMWKVMCLGFFSWIKPHFFAQESTF